jgi:hypothetical protein
MCLMEDMSEVTLRRKESIFTGRNRRFPDVKIRKSAYMVVSQVLCPITIALGRYGSLPISAPNWREQSPQERAALPERTPSPSFCPAAQR